MTFPSLPLPHLARCEVDVRPGGPIVLIEDRGVFEAVGTRIGFTERAGGQSAGPFAGLNLSATVGDDPAAAHANISALCDALSIDERLLVRPKQVHGTDLVVVEASDAASVEEAALRAAQGADGVVVDSPGVAALLCFADCAPVIVVSPSGAFAVAHAGWRGAVGGIASKAVRALAEHEAAKGAFGAIEEAAASFNAYIGPCIRVECFETGPDVTSRFVERYGEGCAPDERHVDLPAALRVDLQRAGIVPERIADAGLCTACEPDRFFSYRASGGTCGRHGAIACHQPRGGEAR